MTFATPFPDVKLLVDGIWTDGAAGATIDVTNPADEAVIGTVAKAEIADLETAVAAAHRGMKTWSARPPLERARIFMKASALLRERARAIGEMMVLEMGKTLPEALGEVERGAEAIDWLAGETQRIYGRLIEPRMPGVRQMVIKEPIGVVAAFSPWNFPVNQIVRKVAGALAAGCGIVVKGPEETPASCAELVRAFHDAGVDAGVLNLVFGVPSEISEFLVPHPLVRKISFTGSTGVGKHLAALAGKHMKVVTMELGGHAPVLVFADADPVTAANALVGNKFRATGQSCISPTRLLVEDSAFETFTQAFAKAAEALKVGPGHESETQVGPLANGRRIEAMDRLVADAVAKGAKLVTGGKRIGNRGWFYEPTVLANVPLEADIMHEEPFGPVVVVNPFESYEDAVAEANRLPYGLAAFAFTNSSLTAANLARDVETGMLSVNHFGLGMPETPFGGIKDSGYGFEGGSEAIEAYLQTRFITTSGI
ncbi:NAD-dependent succinate-semialdehyde dehydrogenase [Novosphingobium profundi]|uniref:NAD-dependent succinate-semialdehyde dehydrogenase n=1 Tax=Novosphingobium profundi TaxID=1774954 RepID=UPI001BDAEBEC|nr:NAD-dependent succinate-semialdehyde dehydrogenase [Novosphingobium profundi]MBT0670468.1 NAD-dependent succinate-semialdehyde dehydrogenase [Novosphingobium profundi]